VHLSFQEEDIIDKNSIETHLAINDLHAPYYPEELLNLVLKFAKDLSPDKFVNMGDCVDCPSISKFDKRAERVTTVAQDFKSGYIANARIAEAVSRAEKIFLHGNHEDRFPTYLASHHALEGLIDMDEKIGLKDYGYKSIPYGDEYEYNGFHYMHGSSARKFAGYTAKGVLYDEWVSGMMGHTHRSGKCRATNRAGDFGFWENGCLCDFKLAWEWFKKPFPNWQWCIAVIKFHDDKFNVHQIDIPRKKPFIIYGNKYYTL